MSDKITVYITKYALTQGIITVHNATVNHWDGVHFNNPNAKPDPDTGKKYLDYAGRKHWHRNPDLAIAKAERMRRDKIALLKRNIAALEQLKFEVK